MKTKLFFLFALFFANATYSQTPDIAGDLLLCPNSTGTASITTDQAYDSYQWYWKYWFTEDPFQAIDGANGPSFTYDWETYDQALLKVVVTLNGETYESNTIQIDSYAWTGLTIGFEDAPNVSVNPENGNVMLCQGTSFTLQVYMPYNNVKWFKDGVQIAGATGMQLSITEPGSYHVVAAPDFCPDSTSSTAGLPIVVEIDTNCSLGIPESRAPLFTCYPNPVKNALSLVSASPMDNISLYAITGQKLFEGTAPLDASLDFSGIAPGMYLLQVKSGDRIDTAKILKQ